MEAVRRSAISRIYTQLWYEFTAAASAQGLDGKIDCPGGRIDNADGINGPKMRCLMYLPSWPYKSTSDRKKVDIIVQVLEVFSSTAPAFTKSTTQVGYFKSEDGSSIKRSVLQMHYDYEHIVQVAHPVFHAQFGKTTWPTDDLADLGFEGLVDSDQEFKAPRIPTAFMGFGQILLMLAADHLDSDNYDAVYKAVISSESARWNAVCPQMSTSLESGGHYQSHHWYCKATRPTPTVPPKRGKQKDSGRR